MILQQELWLGTCDRSFGKGARFSIFDVTKECSPLLRPAIAENLSAVEDNPIYAQSPWPFQTLVNIVSVLLY